MDNERNVLPNSEFMQYPNTEQTLDNDKAKREFLEPPTNDAPTPSKKKKADSSLVTKIVSMTLVGTAAVSGANVLSPTDIQVHIAQLQATDTSIAYTIQVEDTQEDLVLIVTNDFTNREIPLQAGENVGLVESLASNMQYTVIVRKAEGLSGNIQKTSVRTKKKTAKAELTECSATQTEIYYKVYVEDTTEEVAIVLTNPNGSQQTSILQSGENTGVFSSLTPNTKYSVSLWQTSGEKVELFSQIVYTKQELITSWQGVSYVAAATADGTFVFTPQFTDENEWWSQITATLTDMNGTSTVQTQIGQSGIAYEMPLGGNTFYTTNGYLTVTATSMQSGTPQAVTLYRQRVDFIQTASKISNVNVTPTDNVTVPCVITFDMVDENGWWPQDVYVELYNMQQTEGLQSYLTETTIEFEIPPRTFAGSDYGMFSIYTYVDGETVYLYQETVRIKADGFDESAGDIGGDSTATGT